MAIVDATGTYVAENHAVFWATADGSLVYRWRQTPSGSFGVWHLCPMLDGSRGCQRTALHPRRRGGCPSRKWWPRGEVNLCCGIGMPL